MTAPIGAYFIAAKMIIEAKPYVPSEPMPELPPLPDKYGLVFAISLNLVLWTAIITNIWWFS